MLKRWLIGAGILVYLIACGFILRLVLRPQASVPTLTVGNLSVNVDPHWIAHKSSSISSLTRKGFHLNPFGNTLTLISFKSCADESDVKSRIDHLQHLFEKIQAIPGARVTRVDLATQSGPASCVESFSDLDPNSPITITCIFQKDGSTFQGQVDANHLNEALSMIRSTRDSISCPASSDSSPTSAPDK